MGGGEDKSDELPASATSTGKISREKEIRNGIGGDNVPTRRIPRSKEWPFEGAVMDVE
jgi:hypothetical protein